MAGPLVLPFLLDKRTLEEAMRVPPDQYELVEKYLYEISFIEKQIRFKWKK